MRQCRKKKEEGKNMNDPYPIQTASPSKKLTHWVAKTGILTAVAVALMYLEFSLPLVPAFLKFDFSEIAVLLASFSMGPLTGIIIELLKNILHLPATATGGVGELANFIFGASFVGTAGLVYRLKKDREGAFIAMAAGTVVLTAVASIVNYYVMIPFYMNVFHLDMATIAKLSALAGNKWVTDLRSLIVYVFIPFNLFKGIVISAIVAVIYKRVSPLLHR
jgi:riboflavin transporter FmnP